MKINRFTISPRGLLLLGIFLIGFFVHCTNIVDGQSTDSRISLDVSAISTWLNYTVVVLDAALNEAGLDRAPIPNCTQTFQSPIPYLPLNGVYGIYGGYVAGFANEQATMNNVTIKNNGDLVFSPNICLVSGNISAYGIFQVNSQGPPMPMQASYQNVCFQPTIRIYAIPLPQTTNIDGFVVTSAGFMNLCTISGMQNSPFAWMEQPVMQFFAQQVKTAVENHLNGAVKTFFASTMSGIPYPLSSTTGQLPIVG